MIRKQLWLLISLVIVVALAASGCGNLSLTENQKITNAFKTIDLSDLLNGAGISEASSLNSKATLGSKSWTTTVYTNLEYTSNVTNIVIVGEAATATGSFNFSGRLTCSGGEGVSAWSYSFDFSASGQGTATFVKVDGQWRVNTIEDMLLKCDNSGNQAPDIAAIEFTPSNDIAAGDDITLSTTVTSNLSNLGATHLGFLVVTRGFILGVNNNIQWSTAPSYDYSTLINTNPLNYIGNHYGAVVAYQLVGAPDLANHPEWAYGIYFSIRISMFKIHEAEI